MSSKDKVVSTGLANMWKFGGLKEGRAWGVDGHQWGMAPLP